MRRARLVASPFVGGYGLGFSAGALRAALLGEEQLGGEQRQDGLRVRAATLCEAQPEAVVQPVRGEPPAGLAPLAGVASFHAVVVVARARRARQGFQQDVLERCVRREQCGFPQDALVGCAVRVRRCAAASSLRCYALLWERRAARLGRCAASCCCVLLPERYAARLRVRSRVAPWWRAPAWRVAAPAGLRRAARRWRGLRGAPIQPRLVCRGWRSRTAACSARPIARPGAARLAERRGFRAWPRARRALAAR